MLKSDLPGESKMRKLILLPGACNTFGGTVVTLSLLIEGFEQCGKQEALRVLVQSGSLLEKYLQEAGQSAYLESIPASSKAKFLQQALQWVKQQPKDYPLLLDNCIDINVQLPLLLATPGLHGSGRSIYHFCHDLSLSYDRNSAISYNYLGYWLKRLTFIYLAPQGICNSEFTAKYISRIIPNIRGILYQPVDTKRFNRQALSTPPLPLQPILQSGAKVILTASRISRPGILNDKNLHSLIPILVHLKANGHFYHSVVIGQDISPGQIDSQALLESAKKAGVADRFTILPPTFAIEDYYKHASVLVTLALREPFGRTVVEAIACGLPVVGSNTGGIGEILSQSAPEWMVDPKDPKAAAEAIIRIANDENTQMVLAQAQSWVEKHCSVKEYAQKIIESVNLRD
jgi:glycosyltransferase involved in cell wall biosynthesis